MQHQIMQHKIPNVITTTAIEIERVKPDIRMNLRGEERAERYVSVTVLHMQFRVYFTTSQLKVTSDTSVIDSRQHFCYNGSLLA